MKTVYNYNTTMPRMYDKDCNLCGKHYHSSSKKFCSQACYHKSRIGIKNPEFSKRLLGRNNPRWNNGRSKMQNGYILVSSPNHPHTHKNRGYVLEHRLVMEKYLGRYLDPKETIHHKNHVRDDNRIENLELIKNHSEHMRLHHKHINDRWKNEN